jgi:hypothetical protein
MTIKELILSLENLDQDLQVVITGYEGGYNDVEEIRSISIANNVHSDWWYGRHEDASNVHMYKRNDETVISKAILLK